MTRDYESLVVVPPHATGWLPAVILAVVIAACDDDTAQDATSGTSASGAAGSGSAGGAGGGGGVGESGGAAAAGGTAGAPPTRCDGQGVCGNPMMGCQGCAVMGACSDEQAACGASQECQDYVTCYYACGDQACVDGCGTTYPMGVVLFEALTTCVFCEECYEDCDGETQGCSAP